MQPLGQKNVLVVAASYCIGKQPLKPSQVNQSERSLATVIIVWRRKGTAPERFCDWSRSMNLLKPAATERNNPVLIYSRKFQSERRHVRFLPLSTLKKFRELDKIIEQIND